MAENMLELKNISYTAQEETIVRNISMTFTEGTTTAIIGPSGGGKSTSLKLAAGFIVPTEGSVLYRGKDIQTMSRAENFAFRGESAFVFQDSALWANQTIRQILELPLRIHFPLMSGADMQRRIIDEAENVGYKRSLDIRPADLSIGEQKLIAYARAVIYRPRLLYLDEWTESLDEAAARRLVSLVKHEKSRGTTILFVSHDFSIVDELADNLYMIIGGENGLFSSMDEIRANKTMYTIVKEGIST
jgi:phospholipid/cholesterol/gamma-HCH transport system ATP-binding protein